MAYIPSDAEWYLAEIVIEITIAGDSRNVVHRNTVLLRADSPDQAYEKALARGKAEESDYENIEGNRVLFKFKGLRDLLVIYDKLEDGAELTFSEQVGVTESELARIITPKHELGVFASIVGANKPNYAAGDILRDVYERFPDLK